MLREPRDASGKWDGIEGFAIVSELDISDRDPNGFRAVRCISGRGFRKNNRELFAAIPADYVVAPKMLHQKTSESPQNFVASFVAKAIVETLEMMYIQKNDSQ